MTVADKFINKAKSQKKNIVFPEGDEPRILRAARRLKDDAVCNPIIVGNPENVTAAAAQEGIPLDDIPLVDPAACPHIPRYVSRYVNRRNIPERVARRLLGKNLPFAAAIVAAGDADGMVGGIASATAQLLMAAGLVIGYAQGVKTPSSFFIMELPPAQGDRNRVLIFADCALNVDPTPEALADIAVTSAQNARALIDIEPRVAMLSFATRGSAAHARVDKVRQATKIAAKRAPDLAIDGEPTRPSLKASPARKPLTAPSPAAQTYSYSPTSTAPTSLTNSSSALPEPPPTAPCSRDSPRPSTTSRAAPTSTTS